MLPKQLKDSQRHQRHQSRLNYFCRDVQRLCILPSRTTTSLPRLLSLCKPHYREMTLWSMPSWLTLTSSLTHVLLVVLFPISFRSLPILFYWWPDGITVYHYLLCHVFNPESEYSTPQLLTLDSRYSFLCYSQYAQLLTSDSSCLISCHSHTQLSGTVLLRSTHLLHNNMLQCAPQDMGKTCLASPNRSTFQNGMSKRENCMA